MYRILGADGREYGPTSGEVLRRWIAERRVNGQTMTQAEGATGWKPLSVFPEFADLAQPPPIPVAPASFASEGAHPLKNSPMAVAGFVCSLLGLMCCGGALLSILGLVFSIIGLGEIKRHPRQLTGSSLAMAGIVLAILGLLLCLLVLAGTLGAEFFRDPRFHHRFIL